jgi:AcrR family transcriptional regulator
VVAPDDTKPPRPASRTAGAREDKEPSRADQRSRLLGAIVEIVARVGYPETKIGEIASQAGVSRATFYELFENKQACFVAAHRELAKGLVVETARAIADGEAARATDAVFATLVDYAEREPLAFGFLTHEAMLAGPEALEERDELITQINEQIEQAHGRLASDATLPDVPSRVLLGGLIRVLGIRTRSAQRDSAQLLSELIGWIDYYRVPGGGARQWSLIPSPQLVEAQQRVAPGAMAPAPLPRGRHRLPAALVKRVQRERIVHGTAEVIRVKGYASTTVADIVAAAGVSREVFYSHFRNRPDAFVATHQMIFEQLMAATAGAFFASAGPWPEQVWDAGAALTSFVVGAPSFAHFGFVESYALGPTVARRTDDAILAFTVFLREGQRYRPEAPALSPTAANAIVSSAIDMVAYYVRRRRAADLFGLQPLATYMILASFMGAEEAREFVEGKLREIG